MNSVVKLGPFYVKDYSAFDNDYILPGMNKTSVEFFAPDESDELPVFTLTTSIYARRDACPCIVTRNDGKTLIINKRLCDGMFEYIEKIEIVSNRTTFEL